ncbi:cupin [Haloprofundus marisrubri]|uniref:Cupin n=1 Tax=Haloprofundus marisrubri TaxID=1514971 RepID=A0A0W1R9D0_9EURY|nr:cupin domain-containing protein [Haloprofundus marisrubri]KTG09969.1 cupin [Haloprofundus marisrubri]
MEKVDIDDVRPMSLDGELDRRPLTDLLGATDVALNYYGVDPGEAFTSGLHAHLDQEELFYVLEGTATFETKSDPNGETETVEVAENEAIRFAPGEFQQGRNESDERVAALALGAPKESTEIRVPNTCPACGDSDVLAVSVTDSGLELRCPNCAAEIDG